MQGFILLEAVDPRYFLLIMFEFLDSQELLFDHYAHCVGLELKPES